MLSVKICGLTRREDAEAAVAGGADYLGFVFFPGSRRRLREDDADWISEVGGAARVGVFRDQPRELIERVREAAGLALVQLHGDETPELCAALGGRGRVIKAVSVDAAPDWRLVERYAEVAGVLFDTASSLGGGTGRRFDWTLLAGRPAGLEFWLAGGLTAETVARAVELLRPSGVDVASGVESAPGRKDPAKIRAFIAAARRAASAGEPAGA